jgi:hypothetical protein
MLGANTICAICSNRKAKRHCPGVKGEICTLCCGTERENTLICPLDCAYLLEGHRYEWERNQGQQLTEVPHSKYEITDNFLYHNEAMVGALAATLLKRALELPAVQDRDLGEALNALVRTRETLLSGLYYDSVPTAPVPEALFRETQKFLEETNAKQPLKEEDVIKSLVFLERLCAARNNGRPRCRAFLAFLRQQFPHVAAEKTPGGLIVTA